MPVSNGSFNTKFYKLTGLKKEAEKPYFTQIIKKHEGGYDNFGNFGEMNGKVTKIEFEEKEYDGKKYPNLKIHLLDSENDCTEVFSMGFSNIILFNLLNTLAGAEKIDNIKVSVYRKDGYNNLFCVVNGEKIGWKYDNKDLWAKTKKVKVNGEEVTDKTELKEFWIEQIPLINEKVERDLIDKLIDEGKQNADLINKFEENEEEDLPFN